MENKVLLIIMDGVGLGKNELGDAVRAASTPTLDNLAKGEMMYLKAHGTAVGLPSDDDMGNSEVGHNAIGCGQIYSQGAKLVNESIKSNKIFESETWKKVVSNLSDDNTLHFIGLLSDGNVHSHIDHLKALVKRAKNDGVKKVRIHALLDGRDVPPTSGLKYIQDIENTLSELNDDSFDARIASGGGRMKVTMDRYQADWAMVERGWKAHVLGEGRLFKSATEAYNTLRAETQDIDQDLPEFVIGDVSPNGTIENGDSVVFFNFRGDRAIEISMAFDNELFPHFDRKRRPDVFYAGMLEYDGDLHIPKNYLVNPPEIKNTMTEFLVSKNVTEFAVSETQKFGHVTYFWNGNRSEKFSEDLETWVEIPSDNVSFDQRPWMKSAEITDCIIDAMKSNKYRFLRLNYPNGDMVGHTGNFEAVRISIESIDLQLARLLPVAKELGYTVLITADHGNSEDMISCDKKTGVCSPKTSHSVNPVPFYLVDNENRFKLVETSLEHYGLANIASTVVEILGYEPPKMWSPSLLKK